MSNTTNHNLDLYSIADSLGLKPTIAKKRMRCPNGCDDGKYKNFACAADFSKGVWFCHKCTDKGNDYTLAKLNNLNYNSLPQKTQRPEPDQFKQYQPVNLDKAWKKLETLNNPDLVEDWALKIRGFPKDIAKIISEQKEVVHIGQFTPSGDAGLIIKAARRVNRELLFQIRDDKGQLISIERRWNGEGEQGEGPKAMALPNYLCPKKTGKTPRLFGSLPEALKAAGKNTLYIVEGGPDFFAALGVLTATMGKVPLVAAVSANDLVKLASSLQIQLKDTMNPPTVVIVPHKGDTKDKGIEETKKAAAILGTFTQVKIADLPEELGEKADMADCLQELGIEAVMKTFFEARVSGCVIDMTPTFKCHVPDKIELFRINLEGLIQDFIKAIIEDPSKAIALGATPGTGKSWITIKVLAELVRKKLLRVIMVCATHDSLEQTKTYFEEQGVEDITLCMGKGLLGKMGKCKMAKDIAVMEDLGISSHDICKGCSDNDYHNPCKYHDLIQTAQSSKRGQVVLMTTDQFSLIQKHWNRLQLDDRTIVVFDECPAHGFLPRKEILKGGKLSSDSQQEYSFFYYNHWPEPAMIFGEICRKLLDINPEQNLELEGDLGRWCDTSERQEFRRREVYELFEQVAIDILAKYQNKWTCEELLETVSKIKPGSNKDPENKKPDVSSTPGWVPELAATILEENQHRVFIERRPVKGRYKPGGRIIFFEKRQLRAYPEPEEFTKRPPSIFILDAHIDSNKQSWNRFLPDHTIMIKKFMVPVNPELVKVQRVNLATSRHALDNEEHFYLVVQNAKRAIGRMNSKYVVVYTHKKHKEAMKEAFKDMPWVKVEHFGRTRGTNDYCGYNIVIIGEAREDHLVLGQAMLARTGKEPTQEEIDSQEISDVFSEHYEAAYRSRPINHSVTILVIAQKKVYNCFKEELVYGAEIEVIKNCEEEDLFDLITESTKKHGWGLPYNTFKTAAAKTQDINKFSTIRIPLNILYNRGIPHPIEIIKKGSFDAYKSVFEEAYRGFSSFYVTRFNRHRVNIRVSRALTLEQITDLRDLWAKHGYVFPKSLLNFLAEQENELLKKVQPERVTLICTVDREQNELTDFVIVNGIPVLPCNRHLERPTDLSVGYDIYQGVRWIDTAYFIRKYYDSLSSRALLKLTNREAS